MKCELKKSKSVPLEKLIVLILTSIFLLSGILCSPDALWETKETFKQFVVDALSLNTETIDALKWNTGFATNDFLSYHDQLIELTALKEHLLGTRLIHKKGTYYAVAESGSLIQIYEHPSTDEELRNVMEKIKSLQTVTEDNGCTFLYCAVPTKNIVEMPPENIVDYSAENYRRFLSAMDANNIPYLNLFSYLVDTKLEIAPQNIYFLTDHHWKPLYGFLSCQAICELLNQRDGLSYSTQYCDIQNYQIQTKEKAFLGSYGRKMGSFMCPERYDDIELILPRFETELNETHSGSDETRVGSFEDSVLFMDRLTTDNPYSSDFYGVYKAGSYNLQVMKNCLNPDGKKALIICDSFANVVNPYLALQFKELHICDMRTGNAYIGEKTNVEQYIRETHPDYVLVLYNGVGNEVDQRYNFF